MCLLTNTYSIVVEKIQNGVQGWQTTRLSLA